MKKKEMSNKQPTPTVIRFSFVDQSYTERSGLEILISYTLSNNRRKETSFVRCKEMTFFHVMI